MSKLVFVYSIHLQDSATGLSNFVSPAGVKLKKRKMGRCTDVISALYSPKVGGLGNYISYTPYVDPKTGLTKINEATGDPVMIQEMLEKKWNKPAGYFANTPFVAGTKVIDENLTYFQRKSWILQDGCTVFDLANMDDEMGYYVLLASPYVANSETEWRKYQWPRATHYIAIENESDGLKYQKTAIKVTAMGALGSSELTEVHKRKLIALLGLSGVVASNKMTTEQVFNTLFTYLESSTYTSGSNIEKFLNLYNLLKTNDGREKFEAMYILKYAIESKVVYERQGSYYFVRPSGQVTIGETYDEAIEYILSPKRGPEVTEMQALSNK
jgi:hypothetical protein